MTVDNLCALFTESWQSISVWSLDEEEVLNVVKKYGHPKEKIISQKIEEKYFAGEGLEFNDLINLDSLYKSNYQKFSKKDVADE